MLLVATDLGVDVVCAAEDTARVRDALVDAGAVEVDEAAAEVVRVESGRPRYGVDVDDDDDPPGGRAQRARGQLHEGLLRRPGDGRATALARASRTAHLRGLRLSGRRVRRARPRAPASARSAGSDERWSSPRVTARSRWRIVRREAAVGDTIACGSESAVVVDLPFTSG